VQIGPCPFTGETYAILPACTPDLAIVFATQADEFGNTQIEGTAFADEFIAKASHQIIVVAEQIVTTDEIRQRPQDTLIPSYRVNALIHEPWGAHPTASPGHYDYDYEALQEYQQAARDATSFKAYIRKYVLEARNFKEYLDKALTRGACSGCATTRGWDIPRKSQRWSRAAASRAICPTSAPATK